MPSGHFVDWVERSFKNVDDLFWAPVIKFLAFYPREKTPFGTREAMVALPPASNGQHGLGMLEAERGRHVTFRDATRAARKRAVRSNSAQN